MNMRNQLEDGYPKLLRIEPENENKQHHYIQSERHNSSAQHINPSVPTARISTPGLSAQSGNSLGFGKGTSRSSVPERQYGAAKGAVRYNYGYEQQPYQANSNRNPLKRSSTSGSANFYLGGRTSSFGPLGCSAIQKQYSFGSYSAGTSTATDANLLGNEASK